MAGFGSAAVFKPVNPFAGQVARNTTGYVGAFAPPVPAAAPASNFAPGSFGPQVVKNTTGFSPSASGGAPATPAPTLTLAQQRLAELQADPGYASAQANATRSAQDAQSARQAAIRSALVQYGGDLPAGFKDTYGDIDPATLAIAKANPFSQAAQSLRTFTQGQETARQGEAANGSIFSGQAPTDIGNENYGRGLDLYNLANQFASAANGAIGQYAGALNTNAGNLTDALFKAEQNQQTNPAYLGSPVATHTPAASTTHATVTPKARVPFNPYAARTARNAA